MFLCKLVVGVCFLGWDLWLWALDVCVGDWSWRAADWPVELLLAVGWGEVGGVLQLCIRPVHEACDASACESGLLFYFVENQKWCQQCYVCSAVNEETQQILISERVISLLPHTVVSNSLLNCNCN